MVRSTRPIPRVLQHGVNGGAFKVLHGVKRSTTYGVKSGKAKKTAAAAPKRKAPKKAKKTAAKKAKKAKKTVKVAKRVGQNGVAAVVVPASV